jgi:hypothetical protein
MQVAGILSQKTQRTMKALHGGLEAYWKDGGIKDTAKSSPGGAKSAPPTIAPPAAVPQAAPPTPPKKKSAGC